MKLILVLIGLIGTVGTLVPGLAFGAQKIGLSSYHDPSVVIEPEDSLCEPMLPGAAASQPCFIIRKFDRTFLRDNLPSWMEAGRINGLNGEFKQIYLFDLGTNIDSDRHATAPQFEFYLRLNWEGETTGLLGKSVKGGLWLKGQVQNLQDDDATDLTEKYQIQILSLGAFGGSRDFNTVSDWNLAEIFGRNVGNEDDMKALKNDILIWTEGILSSQLPSYFQEGEGTKAKENPSPETAPSRWVPSGRPQFESIP